MYQFHILFHLYVYICIYFIIIIIILMKISQRHLSKQSSRTSYLFLYFHFNWFSWSQVEEGGPNLTVQQELRPPNESIRHSACFYTTVLRIIHTMIIASFQLFRFLRVTLVFEKGDWNQKLANYTISNHWSMVIYSYNCSNKI